jgi:hypothetical protein
MTNAIQNNFIELLKRSAPMHISLAEELSELLQISLDSVYRRLRCETDITLTETFAICKHTPTTNSSTPQKTYPYSTTSSSPNWPNSK